MDHSDFVEKEVWTSWVHSYCRAAKVVPPTKEELNKLPKEPPANFVQKLILSRAEIS